MTPLPLEGIRVCDFTWVVAGPTATRVLADFGAEVIKVEHGQRLDVLRQYGMREDPPSPNRSGMFNYFNRNKKSILVNARHPDGEAIIHGLIAKSDIVVENFSGRVMESLGLGYEKLRELNPGIIYCSCSGFGHSGRDRDYTTWGPTAQALSGLTFTSGLPGKPPAGWGYSFMDHTAGYEAAAAIMMALHHRNRTGEGQAIDLSQVEGGMVLMGPAVLDYTVNGRKWRRPGMPPGNHAWEPRVAPHNTYRCKGDDRWIAIAVMSDEEWQALVRVMGSPGWTRDPRWKRNEGRLMFEDEVDRYLALWAADFDAYELMERLQAEGVRAGVCQSAGDRFERDPQLRDRDWWHVLPHPEMGNCDYDGVVPMLSATPGSVRTGGPTIGEHTREVCRDVLGMNEAEIDACEATGVFM